MLAEKLAEISRLFETWIGEEPQVLLRSSRLREACDYASLDGGKRIRPAVCLLSAEAFGVEPGRLKNFCLAIELIHAFSLVHDDLPALDNDSMRRGKPSCHVAFGEGLAVLTGDTLIAQSFYLISSAREVAENTKVAWLQLLSQAAVLLCDGQALDLEMSGQGTGRASAATELIASAPADTSMDRLANAWTPEREKALLECHKRKTAALFQAALLAPLETTSPRAEETYQLAAHFGKALGLLFQLTDDLLDLEDSASQERVQIERLVVENINKSNELLALLQAQGAKMDFFSELIQLISSRKS